MSIRTTFQTGLKSTLLGAAVLASSVATSNPASAQDSRVQLSAVKNQMLRLQGNINPMPASVSDDNFYGFLGGAILAAIATGIYSGVKKGLFEHRVKEMLEVTQEPFFQSLRKKMLPEQLAVLENFENEARVHLKNKDFKALYASYNTFIDVATSSVAQASNTGT